MKRVILIGGGGHCKVVIDHIRLCDFQIKGILDDGKRAISENVMGCRILGTLDCLSRIKRDVDFAVIAIKDPQGREILHQRCRDAGLDTTGFIHPTAIIARTAHISSTAQICAGSIVNPEARVRDHVIINTRAIVEHDCIVDEFSHIAPSVALMGNVRIGKKTLIGTSSTIIQNLKVGGGVFVGAGSVVIRDIEDGSRYSGVPAKKMGGCHDINKG